MTEKNKARAGETATGAMQKGESMQDKSTQFPRISGSLNDINQIVGLFLVRTANRCIEDAQGKPIPRKLFGEFWFEGELCILFADTNLGKSILAVQKGDSISRGRAIPGFPMEADPQTVLYFDFELGDKQFEARYSVDFSNHYAFSENFHRAEIDPDAELPENYKGDFEAFLNYSLEEAIKKTGAKVLIIDNLTYLKNETEKARDALPLMKHLKTLKTKYGLSILALAHTPKRDLSKPITRNDLSGSKMLMNFCDSAFAIGESHSDKSARYLKQIKTRNTENLYDSENVVLCQISKPSNFLQFEFLGFAHERDHLKAYTENDRENLAEKAKEMKAQGRTQRDISAQLGISLGKVNNLLNKP
jgi:RecA-family ATPase